MTTYKEKRADYVFKMAEKSSFLNNADTAICHGVTICRVPEKEKRSGLRKTAKSSGSECTCSCANKKSPIVTVSIVYRHVIHKLFLYMILYLFQYYSHE